MILRTLMLLLVALPAFAEVTVQEYPLPPRQFAHDVWADPAPDGPVWIAFQRGGNLGRLDPKTGRIDLMPLGSGSSPHGVIAGPDGAPWLTDSGQNAMVRFDPKSGSVKKFPLPESAGYTNLNTAIFDKSGILWFTGQSGSYGRLDPASGDLRLYDAPRGRGPYGMHAAPDGTVYYASLAGSYVGRIDAKSHKVTVLEPPTRSQGARRVWSDSKGVIWVAEWNSGQLSRFEPASGQWKTFKAPGDSPKIYAVYVDPTDRVWVSDWSRQVMLRFDPATGKFETFRSSTEVANVRQIHGRKGEVWTPESAADKVVVYRYR